MSTAVRTQPWGQTFLDVWALTSADSIAVAVDSSNASDRTVQISGTFGGATITVQGSNDNTNWNALHDHTGVEIVATDTLIAVIAENPLFIRAILSGGAGAAVTVALCSRRG